MLGALIATSVPSLMVPLYLGHTKMLRVLWEAVAVSQKKCSQVTLCQRIQRQANISGQSSQLPISVLLRCTFHTVLGRRWTQSCIHRKLQHVAHWTCSAIMLPRRSLLALFRWESVFNWAPLKKHLMSTRNGTARAHVSSTASSCFIQVTPVKEIFNAQIHPDWIAHIPAVSHEWEHAMRIYLLQKLKILARGVWRQSCIETMFCLV